MSLKALSEYTQYAKYAKYIPEKKRRETWQELVERVFNMHKIHLGEKYDLIKPEIEFAKDMILKKRILGSQRALQFGGDPILKKNAKIYNCCASYVDRLDFFKETLYLLLCGCGVGASVQKHHIEKLPKVIERNKGKKIFVIPDTIEGWADSVGVLMQSFFNTSSKFYSYDTQCNFDSFSGYEIEFDYSLIRPQGAMISWGGIAPGPAGLKRSLELIENILKNIKNRKLKPIEVYDIIMHMSDSVLSGGIRRSATIILFSPDDEEMANAKTGDWFITNPQRGRSNNSALLLRDNVSKEQFSKLMKSVKEFGEPGFIWTDNTETMFNPCSEISLHCYDEEGNSGWNFCNLSEINGKKVKTDQDFYDACRAAAILGTIQATYMNLDYLSESTKKIIERDALLGVSITGMMDNPTIIFDTKIQKTGAKVVLETNEKIAKILGINSCARGCTLKPSGTSSCILGTSSGIHPNHAKKYIRRVQANKLEFPAQEFQKMNPLAVEESVWSNNKTDVVLSFLCEVPDGAKTKNKTGAIELLEHVKLTQQNWIEYGTRKNDWRFEKYPWLRHNVSNTISVKPEEWNDVEEYIYKNRKWFAGISLLPMDGDKDYPQAPFTTIYDSSQIVKYYGDGALMASGLIVDGLHAFNNNLWAACDCVLGIGEKIEDLEKMDEPILPEKNGYTQKQWNDKLLEFTLNYSKYIEYNEKYKSMTLKKDWLRRVNQFAERYVNNDLKKCTYLLKDVSNLKLWLDLKREYKEVDWTNVKEEIEQKVDVTKLAGAACSGGACEVGELGESIKKKQEETQKITK